MAPIISFPGDGTKSSKTQEKRIQVRKGKEVEINPAGWWRDTVLSEYVPKVMEILADAGIFKPTIRRVFYTMAQNFPDFPKKKEYYKALVHHLSDVRLRWRQYKDWDITIFDYRLDTFADDSRSEVIVNVYRKPKGFVQEYVIGLRQTFDKYKMPYWEGQKGVVEIMTEKQSMEASFEDIAKPKQVSVIVNKGDTGTSYFHDQYKRWKKIQQEQGKDVHIEFFSDLDTDGEYMHVNMIDKILQMIEDDVRRGIEPLNWDWNEDDWDNFAELKADLGDRYDMWYKKIVGDDTENRDKMLRFTEKILGLSKASWHTKHYDPEKPNFTFERIGMTEEQANKFNLTKLDETPISELSPGTEKYNFAKRHGGYSFAVELDAFAIENQEAFEDLVNDAIEKWHDKEIWKKVKPGLDKKVVDVEIKKRIKFTKLAEQEHEQWDKGELSFDDE